MKGAGTFKLLSFIQRLELYKSLSKRDQKSKAKENDGDDDDGSSSMMYPRDGQNEMGNDNEPTTRENTPSQFPNIWNFSQDHMESFGEYLSCRNFYIIHNHHATAKHFDLRLQCSNAHPDGYCDICDCQHNHKKDPDGGLLSFAIPKGLSGFQNNTRRLAIETPIHPISYATYEGAEESCTGLWDVGTYQIVTHSHPSRSQSSSRKQRSGMVTRSSSSFREESPSLVSQNSDSITSKLKSTETDLDKAPGYEEENALKKALLRPYENLGRTTATTTSNSSLSSDIKPIHFKILLTGIRYAKLALTFSHDPATIEFTSNQPRKRKRLNTNNNNNNISIGNNGNAVRPKKKRNWFVALAGRGAQAKVNIENDIGNRSVLSARTMEEIRKDSLQMNNSAE